MKRFFESRMSLKVASVIIAVALWFFVNSRGVSEITMTVPLEIKNLAEGFEIVSQKENEVKVGLRGHERLIKSIGIKDIRVYLDLAKMKEGWGEYYINNENIKVHRSLSITKIEPSLVKIKIEETVSKDISIRVSTVGTLAKGYRVVSIKPDPEEIHIDGAKSVVRGIKALYTEAVDLSNRDAPFEQTVKVLTNGKNIRISRDDVNVVVEVARVRR